VATTAKISERAKRNLKRVQATVRSRTGRAMTQQAVLERLLQQAARDPESAMEFMVRDRPNFGPEDLERIRKNQFDLGVATREEDIDEELYGRGRRGRKHGRPA